MTALQRMVSQAVSRSTLIAALFFCFSASGVPPATPSFTLFESGQVRPLALSPNGKLLFAVQSNTGKLFTIDPATGATNEIDLGGATLANGDGILLAGRTLYVVQNRLNRITIVRLNGNATRGVVRGTITDPAFDVPTTIDRFGNRLYAVNARFGTPPTPQTTYNVVRVGR